MSDPRWLTPEQRKYLHPLTGNPNCETCKFADHATLCDELLAERNAEIERLGELLTNIRNYVPTATDWDGVKVVKLDDVFELKIMANFKRALQSANAEDPQPVETPKESANAKGESQ